MNALAAATIVNKSTLDRARVLATSWRRFHPEAPFFALLADEIEGCFDPAAEPFTLIRLAELALPQPAALCFRCTAHELGCALTPFLLDHMLDRGFAAVAFLKQESLVVGDLAPLLARLAARPILLTPHLLAPLAGDAAVDRELATLLAGAYNVGLLAVAEAPSARRFLAWWQDRLVADCRHAVAEGLHYEQRWLDLVPVYFDGVEIVREPGASFGHWCLPERRVELHEDEVRVDGAPGRLFRASGYEPEQPERVTKYVDRLTVAGLGEAGALFARYRAALLAAGHEEVRGWPYAFGCFADGTPIPDLARRLYAGLGAVAERFGDPFAVATPGCFRRWLDEPVDGVRSPGRRISRLWQAVAQLRPDVRRVFPDYLGADRVAFLAWAARHGAREHGIADAFLEPAAR